MTVTRPLPDSDPVALLRVADLRTAEARAAAALPPHTLMARAGAAAARWLSERAAGNDRPVWFAVGPGNNGGDALVAAAHLQQLGVATQAWMPVPVKPDDAQWALGLARAAGVPLSATPPASLDDYAWIVDGLFGIGLGRALDGAFAEQAARIAAHARSGGHVLALDVPSGLDSDTGQIVGAGVAVAATHTLTFIGAKPGLYTGEGRDLAGEIAVATLDVAPPVAPAIVLNAPARFAAALPARAFASHKGTFGSLAVLGGDTGMCGAPILAARAALFAGAGKVHVGFLGAGAPPYDPPFPELMLHPADGLDLDAMTAIAAGCGLGTREAAATLVRDVLAHDAATLLDADALNLVATHADLAAAVATHGARGDPCVLTPHPLEAARLLGSDTATVQRDRVAAAQALAARHAAIVVLKGSGTVIAAPDGRVAINPTGNAALATGGTGDVLGGLIGALLAQRVAPYEAALAGVYLHGLAADTLTANGTGPAGLTAGELAPMVRTLINRLFYPSPRADT
ncbi:TPA: NAD(P)H-hydrate dehydratase [Burkholderia aenigmatica]|uniref:NAD(P)H-hydrate dehydratase n=1 Tax=Burkholderia sp. AU45251 TaxID=3059204 RepID=UPI00264D3F25|nr:NAD(P)H-hydrate dehydratase [Burkholderia sp. AU45251]HDR9488065.1 NAD(P)H-hydrate dehydratase [Burkholderia aenigmatica]MDN7520895.1 NAD(P)H-hydrate dehydratase [Burkholderia sp. AU45251]HDR9519783.1 NAD(P)H-hydrate dehydratase [Burkholderia aenigmatica]HDR9596813.1 NAD(P)H-hydrate dehydratase [Burkholderia aenigmatica]HDR9620996.1 NAD(P)H-hydrate dehydratase [Burkholderia aenigmatica]